MKHTIEQVAKAFSTQLLKDIGREGIEGTIIGNRKYAKEHNTTVEAIDICSSHDYCDANMTMDYTLQSLGYVADAIMNDQEVVDLWNKAWRLAKANEFYYKLNDNQNK